MILQRSEPIKCNRAGRWVNCNNQQNPSHKTNTICGVTICDARHGWNSWNVSRVRREDQELRYEPKSSFCSVQCFDELDEDITDRQNRLVGLTPAVLYQVLFSGWRLHDNKHISVAQTNINIRIFIQYTKINSQTLKTLRPAMQVLKKFNSS